MLALARITACGLAAVVLLVVLPASALADVTVSGFSVSPSTKAAGAHPTVTISASFSYSGSDDDLKELVLHFPPGLLGNPQAAAKCTQSQFDADSCPSASQVGTTTVVSEVGGFPGQMSSSGRIYNLAPAGSEPARLGIVVDAAGGLAKVMLISVVTLRTATDFGIDSTTDNIPNMVSGFPITIDSISLTLNATAGDPSAPFMSNPTSCAAATSVVDAYSYNAPTTKSSASDAFTPTDCDKLPFGPGITAIAGAPGEVAKGSHPPLSITTTQQPSEAHTSSSMVTLPAALAANPAALSTLCSSDQLASGSCPADSQIGQAKILSPLLATPLSGAVYATTPTGGLPGLAIAFGGPLSFTLSATSTVTPQLQLQNTFAGLPDMPLSSFELSINGGARGLLTAGDLCSGTPPTVGAAFTGHNGASVSVSVPVRVTGCDPTATAAGRGFAGRRPRLSLKAIQGIGSPAIHRVVMTLPKDVKVVPAKRARGTSVRASATLPRRAFRLSRRGNLSIVVPRPSGAHRVNAALAGGAIAPSRQLRRLLRHDPSVTLQLTVKVVDVSGRPTTLTVPLQARR